MKTILEQETTKISETPFKPIDERTSKELEDLINPVISKLIADKLERGLCNSYRDKNCTSLDLFIDEYKDRKELVSVNAQTGETTFIKFID